MSALKPQSNHRILIVGINYSPERVGTGKYTAEMASWLASRGSAVRVITGYPYYPAWNVWPGYRKRRFHTENIEGVEVIRCPLWVPQRPSGVKRLLHLLSFAVSSTMALFASISWRPTHVVAVAPTLACAPAAWLLARLTGARSWLHIQDFELDAALDMGIVKAGRLKKFAVRCESILLKRFDRVSTISFKMLDRLASKGVDASRRIFFPNWADIDGIQPLIGPSSYRAQLNIPDNAVVALYSGNMGLKQGLELLGEAAHELRGEARLHFVFGGEGPARDALEAVCAGLPNVHFLGLQPSERLNEWLGLADIHLLPQRADVADLVMPSKLTGMLASGRPVLATAMPGTSVAAAVEGCGIVVPPENCAPFVSALRHLLASPDLRRHLGEAARHVAVQTLSRENILRQFEKTMLQMPSSTQSFDSGTTV